MNYKELIKLRSSALPENSPLSTALKHADLKLWLDKLPPLQPKSTVQQLLEALQTNNQQYTNARQQFKILQEYRSIILLVNPSLNLDTLKRLSIREADREQTLALTTSLYLTLTDGYKLLLKDLLNENMPDIQSSIHLPLFHTIEGLCLTLLHGYRAYKSAPRFLFYDIHLLYQLAREHQLTQTKVDTGNLSLAATSIDTLYKQIMYLSCLDPYHLPSGVSEKLYERLSRLARHFDVYPSSRKSSSDKCFFINPARDSPPQHISRLDNNSHFESIYILDPTAINKRINTEIIDLKAEGNEQSIKDEIELLQYLNITAQPNLLRHCERKQAQRPCKITFGIDAINRFLTLTKHEYVSVLESSADNFGQHLIESWDIVNENKEGLCLAYHNITRYDIRVGEIIGLLSEESIEGKKHGRIAVICWIRSDLNNHTHIGIHLIHGNLLPAICRLVDSPNVNNTFPAIFVSSLASDDRPATLVATKKVYHENRVMEVSIGEQPMRIRAGKLLDKSFAFDRFDFSSIKS